MNQKLLKCNDIAYRLNISRAKAYSLMQLGEIKIVRIGKTVRVSEEDLVDFIEEHKGHKLGDSIDQNTKFAAGTTNLDANQVNPILQKESSHEQL